MLARVARVLNEGVMGLLALVAFGVAIGPMVFDVSPDVEWILTVVEWMLVGAFSAQIAIEGVLAQDRAAWIRSPWRIVDALTVLGPIVAPSPGVRLRQRVADSPDAPRRTSCCLWHARRLCGGSKAA
jgi:hypothetical protein